MLPAAARRGPARPAPPGDGLPAVAAHRERARAHHAASPAHALLGPPRLGGRVPAQRAAPPVDRPCPGGGVPLLQPRLRPPGPPARDGGRPPAARGPPRARLRARGHDVERAHHRERDAPPPPHELLAAARRPAPRARRDARRGAERHVRRRRGVHRLDPRRHGRVSPDAPQPWRGPGGTRGVGGGLLPLLEAVDRRALVRQGGVVRVRHRDRRDRRPHRPASHRRHGLVLVGPPRGPRRGPRLVRVGARGARRVPAQRGRPPGARDAARGARGAASSGAARPRRRHARREGPRVRRRLHLARRPRPEPRGRRGGALAPSGGRAGPPAAGPRRGHLPGAGIPLRALPDRGLPAGRRRGRGGVGARVVRGPGLHGPARIRGAGRVARLRRVVPQRQPLVRHGARGAPQGAARGRGRAARPAGRWPLPRR